MFAGEEKLEAKLAKVSTFASVDAGPPAMAPDLYPVEWIDWLHFGPSREFHYGPDSWLSPHNVMYASAGPDDVIHKSGAGKLSQLYRTTVAAIRTAAMQALSPISGGFR